MKKVFISQPMVDKTDEEIKANRAEIIDEVKKLYPDDEIEIIDSFFEDAPHDAKPAYFLGKSITLLSEADVVVMGKDWAKYRGCNIEHRIAVAYGYEILYLDNNKKMTIGDAIRAAKAGEKIAREGWNGKNMFVVYQKGYPEGIPCNMQTAEAWGMNEGDNFICNPYLQIKNADGSHSMWAPSIGDTLADDWYVVV